MLSLAHGWSLVILLTIYFHHGLLVIMSRLMRTGLLLKLVEKLKKKLRWLKNVSLEEMEFEPCHLFFFLFFLFYHDLT